MIEERKKLKQLNDSVSLKKFKHPDEMRKRPPLDEVRIINPISPKQETIDSIDYK